MYTGELPTPALLIDLEILERNLAFMQGRSKTLGVALRPHIKTHKCIEIAERQLKKGASGITVSTFYEAEQFAAAGFNDITWAFPIPPVYATKVLQFSDAVKLSVVIDSTEAKGHLDKACRTMGKRLHVWLKVDCGYHRAGVDPGSKHAEHLAQSLADSRVLVFEGILSHSGHSYYARSRNEILPYAREERDTMVEFAEKLRSKGINIPAVSVGSTPAMVVVDHLNGVSEMRPGNYAFYDFTQAMIGSCTVADCALTVLASVISHQPGSSHFVTDAGALALSKDVGPTHVKNQMGMGSIYEDYDRKRLYPHLELTTLSQEHGKVTADAAHFIEEKFTVGEKVRILEHHSCLTAAQFDRYYVVKGDEVVHEWKILRGRT